MARMTFVTGSTSILLASLIPLLYVDRSVGAQVNLSVNTSSAVLKANHHQTAYLKIGLTGFEFENASRRAPVNVAIVLDKSGSMQGDKIEQAKRAAIMAIERLGPNDIVSVVAYDGSVRVLVPSTKVSDKAEIRNAISRLNAGGNTALFGGVSKGAQEVRKFLSDNRFNRVILLSDGIANVGPSSPGDLASLGASLIKESISVTTLGLGLGYNEDLMVQLAAKSDGNHAFIESAVDLARVFDEEFGDILTVCAQEVVVRIQCADGVRPKRILGRSGDITGQSVAVSLSQLYANQEKYILLEVELDPFPAARRDLANIDISYANMETLETDSITATASVRFDGSDAEVKKALNKLVMVAVVEQIGIERNERAIALRDKGKNKEAKKVLNANAFFLKQEGQKYDSKNLIQQYEDNQADAASLDGKKWKRSRRAMKSRNYQTKVQQRARGQRSN
jgi:Ca-activated chloride channel family protein